MDRLELHLKATYLVIMIALGMISCGMVPLFMWLLSIKDYPKALDPEGVTLRSGQRLPWKALTEKKKLVYRIRGGRAFVGSVTLSFGKTRVNIAPRALKEGSQVLSYLSRVAGEDFTKP